MSSFWDLMQDVIPDDHARQVTSREVAAAVLSEFPVRLVVDLGCGSGASKSHFDQLIPDADWIGIDIASSPEVAQRKAGLKRIVTYDGVRLPLRTNSVPFVYSHQVFEHVLHPRDLLAEVGRVLKPGGHFVGSTSQFEPFHSLSVWNYTPYGFRLLLDEANLELQEVRPGIDGMTLIQRSYKGRPKRMSRFFGMESPLNREIDAVSKKHKLRPALINSRKLQFCGQFTFKAVR